MRKRKWCLLLFIAMVLTVNLTGCDAVKEKLGLAFPAKAYVEGVLEAVYHGNYEKYQLYTEERVETAIERRKAYVEGEVEYFSKYLNIENISTKGRGALAELIEALYNQVRFEVQEPVKKDRAAMVEVVVYPVDFFSAAGAELEAYIQDYSQKLAQGEWDSLSTEEQKQQYEDGVLEICSKYSEIEDSSFQISVNLQVEEVQEGYYQITEGMEKLDELVLVY